MASLRSWLGSFLSFMIFWVLCKFTRGFAMPAFAAIAFACVYLWTAVLRIAELKALTPEEPSTLFRDLPAATADTTGEPASESEEEEEEGQAEEGEAIATGSAAGAPTEGPSPQALEASRGRDEGAASEGAQGPGVEAEVPAATATSPAGEEGATTVGSSEAPAGDGQAAETPTAHKPARPKKKKRADDEWGDESEGSEAEEERRRRAQDELADPARAQELRAEGNELFKAGKLHDAQEAYSEALYLTPSAQEKEKAILHCNRAACLQKLGRWDDVIHDCGEAVKLDKEYVKAYCRRSLAFEHKERWHDALEDLKKAIELDPSLRSKEYKRQAVLEKRSADQFDKDKDEMMGKLKELGNTVLGKFGMSCDNFKLVQDPNTGGYSISYQQ